MSKITITSPQLLNKFRFKGDDEFASALSKIPHTQLKILWSLQSDEELIKIQKDKNFKHVVQLATKLPDWIETDKMKQSDLFFEKEMFNLMLMLGLVSLPYCYGGADGSKVLTSSKRILENTSLRLSETGTFVWDVCTPDAFSGKKKGFLTCFKVRMIHQHIRSKLLPDWNIEENGFPVNQLDQAGTNLSFSLIAIRGLRNTGVKISQTAADSYLHRWNVISYLLGLDEDVIAPDMRTASVLSRGIEKVQFRPSEEGKMLTNALVESFYSQEGFTEKYKLILKPYMAYLIGEPTAQYLGLKTGFTGKLFELNALLEGLREFAPWIPRLGFDKPDGEVDMSSFMSDIPLIT